MQSPDFTQSYNRYSYVWNNPLKYTDPSGYLVANGSGWPETDYYGRPKYDRCGVYIPSHMRSGGGTAVGWFTSDNWFGGGGGTHLGQTTADGENFIQFWNSITEILLNSPSGYTISLIQAFGRINYVGHFGELGEPIIHETGAISFSNNTAGLDAILNAVYGNVAANSGGNAPNLTNRVGGFDYVGYGVDGIGFAAEQTAKTTFKYGQRVNGVVKSAAQLTAENAAVWGKVATRFNVAGGIIGVVDCGMQSYDDFSNGNYGLGAYEATKAASYTTGSIMLFTPLAPIGAGILLVTGVVYIAGDIGMYIYGRNQ